MNNKHSVFIKSLGFLIFTLSLFGFTNSINAQEYDIDYTVDFINQHLDESCKIVAQKRSIQIEYYRNGKVVRIDDFYPSSINIDEDIFYSHPEKRPPEPQRAGPTQSLF